MYSGNTESKRHQQQIEPMELEQFHGVYKAMQRAAEVASRDSRCHWAHYRKTTSSTKPEVHNILQRRHRRTETRPQTTWIESFLTAEVRTRGSYDMQCRQTDRQTHIQTVLIAVPRSPTGAEYLVNAM